MRLTEKQRNIIRESFRNHFGPEDHLWLFGSRVDDEKKGGDIDLYIQTQAEDAAKVFAQKRKFSVDLQLKLGEQKIDIVLHRLKDNTDLRIYKAAQTHGILLI